MTTQRIPLASITQPKMLVDNLQHIHDHGMLVEFAQPKLARLMGEIRNAYDGKLVLRAGESELTLEKVGRVIFTTLNLARYPIARSVHYVNQDSPSGELLRYTFEDRSHESDEYQVLRAVILGEKLPKIMRPSSGEAQDEARKFAKKKAWAFLGEKGLHTKALERAKGDCDVTIDRARREVTSAQSDFVHAERKDFAAEIEYRDAGIRAALEKRSTKKAQVEAWIKSLRDYDAQLLPATTAGERAFAMTRNAEQWEAYYTELDYNEGLPSSLQSALSRGLSVFHDIEANALKVESDKMESLRNSLFPSPLAAHLVRTNYLDGKSHNYAHTPPSGDVHTVYGLCDTPMFKGQTEAWSHTQTLPNYSATLEGDEIRLSSGVVCPFPASRLLAFLRGEVKAIATQYGHVQRIETREGDKAKVIVRCGCHYVDVSTLSPEFGEACEPRHVVTKTEGTPDLPLTVENWSAIVQRCEAIAQRTIANLENETRETVARLKAEKHELESQFANRDAWLGTLLEKIEQAKLALASAEQGKEAKLASLSYEWRDAAQIERHMATLFSCFQPIAFEA